MSSGRTVLTVPGTATYSSKDRNQSHSQNASPRFTPVCTTYLRRCGIVCILSHGLLEREKEKVRGGGEGMGGGGAEKKRRYATHGIATRKVHNHLPVFLSALLPPPKMVLYSRVPSRPVFCREGKRSESLCPSVKFALVLRRPCAVDGTPKSKNELTLTCYIVKCPWAKACKRFNPSTAERLSERKRWTDL